MLKAARLLIKHVLSHGLFRGVRLVWLKSHRSTELAKISSPMTGGAVFVRPGTADMAIYDQIVLQPYLPRDRKFSSIIDCGANIGLTARYLNSAYPTATLIAIEPDARNFDMLVANTSDRPNIRCVRAGIWPTLGHLDLQEEGLRYSSFQTKKANAETGLEAVTITEIMRRFDLPRVSLLKIDIEGSELELFSGADTSWIERIDAIAIELHDSWRPGCGDAFFKAISRWSWSFSFHGGAVFCERRAM